MRAAENTKEFCAGARAHSPVDTLSLTPTHTLYLLLPLQRTLQCVSPVARLLSSGRVNFSFALRSSLRFVLARFFLQHHTQLWSSTRTYVCATVLSFFRSLVCAMPPAPHAHVFPYYVVMSKHGATLQTRRRRSNCFFERKEGMRDASPYPGIRIESSGGGGGGGGGGVSGAFFLSGASVYLFVFQVELRFE